MITWPDSLPLPLLKSHSTKPKSGLVSTKLDSGRKRVRRRTKNPPTEMQAQWLFTDDEYALFEGIIAHDLNGGADYFLMPVRLPIGLVTAEVRIIPDSIQDNLLAKYKWKVKAKIEIRKRETIDKGATEILRTEGVETLEETVGLLRQVFK